MLTFGFILALHGAHQEAITIYMVTRVVFRHGSTHRESCGR